MSTRVGTVIARTKQYLGDSKSVKVEVEELESFLGPDDSDVDFRRILEEATDEKGCAIFETFSSDGPSEFLVVIGARWDKHQRRLTAPWRQHSSTSSSGGQLQAGRAAGCMELVGKKGYLGSGRLPGKMGRYKSGHSWSASWSQKTKRGGSNIFQLFDTAEKKDPFVASRRRWLKCQGKMVVLKESWQQEQHDIEHQEPLRASREP